MTELVAITFNAPEDAFALRDQIPTLMDRHNAEVDDAMVVTREANGSVKLHQSVNLPLAQALGGGVWGLMLGGVFMAPFVGAAIGAGAGLMTGNLSNVGIDDDFAKQMGETLGTGHGVLLLLVRRESASHLIDLLEQETQGKLARILRSPVDKPSIARLRGAKTGQTATNDYPV